MCFFFKGKITLKQKDKKSKNYMDLFSTGIYKSIYYDNNWIEEKKFNKYIKTYIYIYIYIYIAYKTQHILFIYLK